MAELLVRMSDIDKSFPGVHALDHCKFELVAGEVHALIGENGAGKSTLIKLFNGLLKPTSGYVLIDTQNTKTTKTSKLARSIGFLFQNPDRQLCQNTIEDEIRFGLSLIHTDEAFIERQVTEVIAAFGFDGRKNPLTASRGEKQRIALAGLLALNSEILVLDEPTTGLDFFECMQILDIIKEQNRVRGMTVVMVSHDMELVNDFADRTLLLSGGTIIKDAPTRDVMRDERALNKASLLPAQIIGVINRFDGEFSKADTYEALADLIESRCRA